MRTIDDVLNRLRADGAETRLHTEFLEMPGLCLKLEQVQRLCGVERTMCQMVLDALVDAKFLCVRSDGHYARLTDGKIARPRRAHADLRPEQRFAKASRASGNATLTESAECSG